MLNIERERASRVKRVIQLEPSAPWIAKVSGGMHFRRSVHSSEIKDTLFNKDTKNLINKLRVYLCI